MAARIVIAILVSIIAMWRAVRVLAAELIHWRRQSTATVSATRHPPPRPRTLDESAQTQVEHTSTKNTHPDQEICSSSTLTRTIFLPHPLKKIGKKGTEEERIHTKHKFKVGEMSLVQSAKEINHPFSITSTPDSAMRTIPR